MFLLKRKFSQNIFRSSFIFVASLAFQLAQAGQITLTDAQLDRISAGYVNLEVHGSASAHGPNAVAEFTSNVEQATSEVQTDNYTYTTTTGSADAFAKGKKVSTEVGFFVETDEEILSFNVTHTKSSSNKKRKSNKTKSNKSSKSRNQKNNKKRNNRVTKERQQLTVTIQTRQSDN